MVEAFGIIGMSLGTMGFIFGIITREELISLKKTERARRVGSRIQVWVKDRRVKVMNGAT